jgi:hypothetical protein
MKATLKGLAYVALCSIPLITILIMMFLLEFVNHILKTGWHSIFVIDELEYINKIRELIEKKELK